MNRASAKPIDSRVANALDERGLDGLYRADHVGAAAPRTLFQQQPLDALSGHGRDIFDDLTAGDPFEFEGGFTAVPDGPGLGVEIDQGELRERAGSDPGFRFPVWRHEDGSVARW